MEGRWRRFRYDRCVYLLLFTGRFLCTCRKMASFRLLFRAGRDYHKAKNWKKSMGSLFSSFSYPSFLHCLLSHLLLFHSLLLGSLSEFSPFPYWIFPKKILRELLFLSLLLFLEAVHYSKFVIPSVPHPTVAQDKPKCFCFFGKRCSRYR